MDTFATHCFIEFYYGLGKGFLNEHSSVLPLRELNESYGLFNGCVEVAQLLKDNIIKEMDNIEEGNVKIVNVQLNNNWINRVELMLYYNPNGVVAASYMPSESDIVKCGNGNEKTDKYYPLRINVNMFKANKKRLLVTIMHELTHAYEDYNLFIKGENRLIDKAMDIGYNYNNIGSYNGYKNYLSYLLYYITEFERNAFVSELKAELQNTEQHFMNISDIIQFLKSTSVYKNYQKIITYIDFFTNLEDKESQEIVFKWLNELSNLKFDTYGRFAKYLKNKQRDIERKINTFIPKIAYEYLKFGNILISFNGKLPEINDGIHISKH